MPISPSPAVRRAGDLLGHLVWQPTASFSVSELARVVDVPRATCDAILQALAEHGFVSRRPDRRYELGPSCITLGDAARAANPVLQAASIEADAFARSGGACVAVCVRDADEARVAEVFDFGSPFGGKARVGQSIPLVPPFGAVFVAWDPTDAEQWLAHAESTLGRLPLERCRRALDAVRRRGYSVTVATPRNPELARALETLINTPEADDARRLRDDIIRDMQHSEYLAGDVEDDATIRLTQMSAPVFDRSGRTIAALMLLGPEYDITSGELHAMGDQLVAAAARDGERGWARRRGPGMTAAPAPDPRGGAAPEVPATLDALLEPEWLSAALGLRFPGVRVVGVNPGPVVERISTNARFRIECDGELPDGLVPTLCAKGYFSELGRALVHVGEPEARFYRDLASATGVHTLRSVYADVHPETRHGVVITEDVIEAGGTFLDALSPYSPDQVARSLEELARLHGTTWGDAALASEPWLASRLQTYFEQRGEKEIRKNFEGAPGREVPDDVRIPGRLLDAFRTLAARKPGAGWAVIHGDAHVGNLFLDARGRPGLVDWQLVQHGHWSTDVGYHIASALEPADRRAHERDLLAHYLDALAGHGVEPPAFDAAWTEYRGGAAYGFFMWAITLYVHPDIIETLVRRLGIAVHDLDSFELLESGATAQ